MADADAALASLVALAGRALRETGDPDALTDVVRAAKG